MQYQYELIWLAKQLEKQKISEEPSIWNAIRKAQFTTSKISVESKRHVYITGDPQVVYQMTNLFDSVASLDKVLTLTSEQNTHPALQWMTISYYPPSSIEQFPKNKALTLFTEGRLPLWSRNLFIDDKICKVVSTEPIPTLSRMPKVERYVASDFSYGDLLDDVIVPTDEKIEIPLKQLYPEIPKQYVLKISALQNLNDWEKILDDAAASMLNTYWLQNRPTFPQWMPVLLREISHFLMIRENIKSPKEVLEKLKVWGKRDKRIG